MWVWTWERHGNSTGMTRERTTDACVCPAVARECVCVTGEFARPSERADRSVGVLFRVGALASRRERGLWPTMIHSPYHLRGARRAIYAPPTDPMQGVKTTDGATADQTAVAVSANPSADRKLPTTDKTLDPADALIGTKTSPSAGQADSHRCAGAPVMSRHSTTSVASDPRDTHPRCVSRQSALEKGSYASVTDPNSASVGPHEGTTASVR